MQFQRPTSALPIASKPNLQQILQKEIDSALDEQALLNLSYMLQPLASARKQ